MTAVAGSPLAVVAAAVLSRDGRKVLLAKRHAQAHQGGKWEFPGGKVQAGESAAQALARELEEELGIRIQAWRPLIRLPYAYPEFAMDFEVFRVLEWHGTASGREGQEIRWVPLEALPQWETPPASRAVIAALRLPAQYAISADPQGDLAHWRDALAATLQRGTRLLQLRAHSLPEAAYERLATEAIEQAHAAGARIVLNAEPALAPRMGADGAHLTSARLQAYDRRPLPEDLWLGASCHTPEELRQAMRIGADFAVLSPVRGVGRPLGWERYREMLREAAIPVYALGGMRAGDEQTAIECGGQGIAAIRSLWG